MEPFTPSGSTASAIFAQDDFRVRDDLTLNLGIAWEYTSPWVEKDDRQSNIDLTHGAADPGRPERQQPRALSTRTTEASSRAWASPGRRPSKWVVRGGVRDRAIHGGHGQEPAAHPEPAVQLRRPEGLRRHDRRRHRQPPASRTSSPDTVAAPGRSSGSSPPDLRPQLTKQWNVFVERKLTDSLSAQVGYVGSRSSHMVVPFDFNQPEPGPGPVSTWRPLDQRRPLYPAEPGHRRHQRHELDRRRRLRRPAGEPAPAPHRGAGVPRVLHLQQGAERQRRLLRRRLGSDRGPGLLLPRQHRSPDATTDRRPTTCATTSAWPATTSCPFGKGRKIGSDWSGVKNAILGGWNVNSIFQAHSGLAFTVIRRCRPVAAGHPLLGAAEPRLRRQGRRPGVDDAWVDINCFQHAPGGPVRRLRRRHPDAARRTGTWTSG